MAAAFAAMFTTFGVVYSFGGAFFRPMAAEFHTGSGVTSLVFSLTAFVYFGLGPVTGAIGDRLGARLLLMISAFLLGAGLWLTSISSSLWLSLVAYSLLVGTATACAYVPSVALVGRWFERGRSLALGIAVTGIGTGTLVVPPLAAALVAAGGWRSAYRWLAVIGTGILVLCAVAARRPALIPPPTAAMSRIIVTPAFLQLYAGGLLVSVALWTAFVHLPPFAVSRGTTALAAATLITVIGLGSIAGRTAIGWLAERVGSIRAYQFAFMVMAASFGIWSFGDGYGQLTAFALLLGAGYGGWVALSPAVLAHLFGTANLGGTTGILYTCAGIGALLGPPVAGFLVDRTGDYRVAIMGSLVAAIAAGLTALWLRPAARSGTG